MKKHAVLLLLLAILSIMPLAAQYAVFGHAGQVTGGGNQSPVLVDSYDALNAALASSDPKVIVITKDISFANKSRITCSTSNKTILAKKGVVLETTGFESKTSGVFLFKNCSNIILRNVKMVGPGADDRQCQDLLNLDGATQVWVDHCEFSDGVDGNFDIVGNSDNITVSWCRFFYEKTPKAEHQFSNLIASNATMKPLDGRYTITYAYNWWDHGCAQRMTRSRNADLHFFNNYWNSRNASYYIGVGTSNVYVEGCYFDGNVASKNILRDAYEGDCQWTIVDSYATTGLPADQGKVEKPTYPYTLIPYEQVPALVTDVTCGAGATLVVNDDGSVSSLCEEGYPSLRVMSGDKDQTVTPGTAITPVVFVAAGTATAITVHDLPAGITSSIDGLQLTLSGTPSESGTYTITATDGEHVATLSGKITVKSIDQDEDLWTGNELCVDLTDGGLPSIPGVSMRIINDGTGAKATTWSSDGVKFNTNKAGITFDLSALNRMLISISFEVKMPNWTSEKNTFAYGFAVGEASEIYQLENGDLTTITLTPPAHTTGFTICRTAGTGTFVSNVCFVFEEDDDTALQGHTDVSVLYYANTLFNPSHHTLSVYSVSGVLMEQSCNNVSLMGYPCGVYLVRVENTGEVLKVVR